MITSAVLAQQSGGLPDSVIVNDSVDSTENVVQQADSSANNPTDDKKPEKEEQLVSRIVPDSVVFSAKRDKDFEYANDPAYWAKKKKVIKEETDGSSFAYSKWLRAGIFLLVGAILLFAFYKIVVENKLYMFYSSSKTGKSPSEPETQQQEEDLDEKIADSLRANDLRSGIRFMYLKALKKAGEAGFIQFRQHATNHDYIREIQDHALRDRFRFLTGVFDYTSYGGFTITQPQFEKVREQFQQFYKLIAD